MQRINVEIVNPAFLAVFIGAPVLYLVLGLVAFHPSLVGGRWWLAGGAACYLVGVLGVTIVANIPLNDALAAHRPASAQQAWPAYVSVWTGWNHVRTAFAFAAVIATVAGALASAGAKVGW